MHDVLVTGGSSGQLGQSIKVISDQFPDFRFFFVDRENVDLTNLDQLESFLMTTNFDLLINCAAYTAVDKAETEAEQADLINHIAVQKMAEVAKAKNVRMIHVSTDYVFNGQNFKPYVESDVTDPQGEYGSSKLNGELAMIATGVTGAIVRTSWVYSEFGHNFVKTMIRLGHERDSLNVVYDQIGTPTYAGDLAEVLLKMGSKLLEADNSLETYHFSNEGVCSWYDFTQQIFEIKNVPCSVSPIESKDYPTPAKRPHYSVLNKAKIKADFDISIPFWKDSLRKCLEKL